MKNANDWVASGLMSMEFAYTADHWSERIGGLEDAVADFDRALAIQPDHAEAWCQKGRVLAELDRYEAAAAALTEAVRLRPDAPDLWRTLAQMLARLNRHDEALAACDETLIQDPDDQHARLQKAETLGGLGRHEDALAAWDQVLSRPAPQEIFPVWTMCARIARAGALAKCGRGGEAIAAYREALAADHDTLHGPLTPALFHQALAIDEARTAYHEHLRQVGADARTWRTAAHIYYRAGRWQESLEASERLIDLEPDEAGAWASKAEALLRLGRRDEALDSYREAVRHPNSQGYAARLQLLLDDPSR